MAKKAKSAQSSTKKPDVFVRLRNVTKPTDTMPAYQPELLIVRGDKMERMLVDKPDVKEVAYSKAAILVDPMERDYERYL